MSGKLGMALVYGALSAGGMALLLWLRDPAPWEVVGLCGVAAFNAARLSEDDR